MSVKSKSEIKRLASQLSVKDCDAKISGYEEQIEIFKDQIIKYKEIKKLLRKDSA